MKLQPLLSISITVLFIAAATAPVRAQEVAPEEGESSGSTWNLLLEGGVLIPLRALDGVNQSSLTGGLRIGKTTRYGLGLDVAAAYSPLSHKQIDGAPRLESHYATLAVLPRFTLGKGALRTWLAGGGGVAYERTLEFTGMDLDATHNDFALVAVGSAGIEFHPIAGLGIALAGTYHRTYGNFDYELVTVTAGLAFSFH